MPFGEIIAILSCCLIYQTNRLFNQTNLSSVFLTKVKNGCYGYYFCNIKTQSKDGNPMNRLFHYDLNQETQKRLNSLQNYCMFIKSENRLSLWQIFRNGLLNRLCCYIFIIFYSCCVVMLRHFKLMLHPAKLMLRPAKLMLHAFRSFWGRVKQVYIVFTLMLRTATLICSDATFVHSDVKLIYSNIKSFHLSLKPLYANRKFHNINTGTLCLCQSIITT
jgi:hypothetical protein